MKLTILATVAIFAGGTALVTEYKKDKTFHVEHEARYTLELTEFELEVDGERQDPQEMPKHKSESRWHIVQTDAVRGVDGDKPAHVRRLYDTAEGHNSSNNGTEERNDEVESPFENLTLDLTRDGDEVRVEVVDGKAPEHDGALDGHRLELCLDALLPKEPVEKGTSWELDNEHIRRALGLELHAALFPKKADTEPQGEGGEGRGRRGRFGMMSRGGDRDLLALTEWTGTATIASLAEDVDGVKCAKIALELHAQGSLPEPEPGEGRRGRMPMTSMEPAALLESTYSIELEGALLFELDAHRPLRLALEGKVELEMNRESARSEHTIRFRTKSEGEVVVRTTVGEGKAEEK